MLIQQVNFFTFFMTLAFGGESYDLLFSAFFLFSKATEDKGIANWDYPDYFPIVFFFTGFFCRPPLELGPTVSLLSSTEHLSTLHGLLFCRVVEVFDGGFNIFFDLASSSDTKDVFDEYVWCSKSLFFIFGQPTLVLVKIIQK
ncbi:hypothetical protein R1sor_018322 [Riccia sorocarpa]|uniref:Uncharacterized protein n=1 Tax=Riccia sorocarpa TaxID=122646 RepID=A0ABD3ICX7_9MARC